MATSPWVAYSSALAALASIQPLPVVPATAIALRSKPPSLRSSSTAICARSPAVGAVSSPTNARTGSTVSGSPTTAEMSAAVGPEAMKARPSRPMLSQLTPDVGPPDRLSSCGLTTPGLSSLLLLAKIASATLIAPP